MVMLPSLPDVAGGWVSDSLIERRLDELLPASVEHISECVTTIDLEKQCITTQSQTRPYDHLLIAGGSTADFHGFNDHMAAIHRLDSLESACRIRDAFPPYLSKAASPHVVVAGGGYTGMELAAALKFRSKVAGKRCAVTIVEPSNQVLPFLEPKPHKRVIDFLEASGIELQLGKRVTGFDGGTVSIGERAIHDAFFCWAAGSKMPIADIQGAVTQLRDGRLEVRPDLSLPNYPMVFVAGDCAAVKDGENYLRKAINFAWYEGARAGKNIVAQIQAKRTRPFHPFDLGWIIPLHVESVGRVFGCIPVYGKLGLRMHYAMCGFRNFSAENFLGFLKIALRLFK
jgi:NADH dehydrogenase